ncbi:MAG TPA: 4-hydroxythreonine-4-phosphate dehydrogenase PdxA [Methylovirgula sp.]|nr:4-hydroxythreonine-4-phosphate dehydrogenase PdxA [Methylovirgula sp.]
MERPALLALTRGDPSGVGPELALKAWLALHAEEAAPIFFIIADPDHLAGLARRFDLPVPIETVEASEAAGVFGRALPVLPLGHPVKGVLGRPDATDSEGTIRSIEIGVERVHSGQADAIVTSPIAKEVLKRAGFKHPGHTEFLGQLAQRFYGEAARPVMLLWSPELMVVPATIHVPLKRVPQLVDIALLVETGKIVARDLQRRFAIKAPRLAFAGLNPHAGEGGHMGREEIAVIAPAVAELKRLGIDARGPYPADTLFHAAARANYDVAIGMYHDQVLVPIKTLAFDKAVNVTLGLPFVRCSPDHGTAFDIAGEGRADPSSLIAALRLAGRMARVPTGAAA